MNVSSDNSRLLVLEVIIYIFLAYPTHRIMWGIVITLHPSSSSIVIAVLKLLRFNLLWNHFGPMVSSF
jgi:hypothetical protein